MGGDPDHFTPPTYAPLRAGPVPLPPPRAVPRYVHVEFAEFRRRFVAALIDGIIVGLPCAALVCGLFTLGSTPDGSDEGQLAAFVGWLATTLAGWLYFAFLESGRSQATLGKQALGIIVTDLEGRRISFRRATGRYFGKMLSSVFFLGYLLIFFTQKRQALHDLLAGTLVIMG
jgi:uncharacterized RDD family membrane protein YckC